MAAHPFTENAPFARDEQDVPVTITITITVTATGPGGNATTSTTPVVDGTIRYPVPVNGAT